MLMNACSGMVLVGYISQFLICWKSYPEYYHTEDVRVFSIGHK